MDWDDPDQVMRRAAGAVFGLVVFSMVLAVTKTKLKRTQTRVQRFRGSTYDRFMGWASG